MDGLFLCQWVIFRYDKTPEISFREDDGFRNRWDLYCKKNAYVGDMDFDQLLTTIEDKIKALKQI